MRTLFTMGACVYLAASLSQACAAAPFAAYDSPVLYDGLQESSEYLRSFDGTRLAITIRRPTRDGNVDRARLPVIVTQDRSLGARPQAQRQIRYFTDRGYVWVAQDRRGTGASFGTQTGFVNAFDAQDAKAVIEWAGAQSFSSGKVVALGCSNQGAWQYVVAALAPKHLVAIVPACASPQFFDHGVAINGVPIFAAADRHYAGECDRAQVSRQSSGVATTTRRVDADGDGTLLAAARAQHECNATMLGQYWLNMPRDGMNTFARYRPAIEDSAISHVDRVRASGVAILQIGGWFDAAVAGQFEGLRQWGGRLIMGPWVHGNRSGRDARLANADVDLDAQTLRWFDFHAKSVRNGADRPAIAYYTLNAPTGQEWREAERWPPTARNKTRLFLTQQGLLLRPPENRGAPAHYPQQQVRWFEGQYQPLARWWTGDMSGSAASSLSHTLEPLKRDTEMTGTPTARLWISADTKDVNVYAVLEDVAPNGRSTYVTDGRLRASWRKVNAATWGASDQVWHRGFAQDIAPLAPGEPVELVFDFFPISYVFKQGHRPRISLATTIGEAYQAPPLADGKTPTLTLYRDAARPSSVELPFVTGP